MASFNTSLFLKTVRASAPLLLSFHVLPSPICQRREGRPTPAFLLDPPDLALAVSESGLVKTESRHESCCPSADDVQ